MTLFPRLRSWLRSTLHRGTIEHAMDEELRFHIDRYVEDLIARGIPAEEAARRARAEFGSVAARKDECREALGLRLLDEIRADLRYTIRLLRRSPAFTLIAVLSIGLGIGANTAIFSLVDIVLLQRLPVVAPDRLFFIDDSGGKSAGGNTPPYPCYEILRDNNRYLSGMSAFSGTRFKATIDGVAEQIQGQFASGSYFDVLGVPAVLGRVLTPADDSEIGRGGPDGPVAVISYGPRASGP